MLQRHGMVQQQVSKTENGSVCSDADRERKQGSEGKGRRFAELAESETAIGEHRTKPVTQALFADLFFNLFDAAEFDAGGALRFVLRHACAQIFFFQHFDVRMDLAVQVGIDAAGGEEVVQEASDFHKQWHLCHLLFVPKSDHGIDARGAPRRNETGGEHGGQKQYCDDDIRWRIGRLYFKEEAFNPS